MFKSSLDSELEDSVSYAELSPNAFLSMPPNPEIQAHTGPDSGSISLDSSSQPEQSLGSVTKMTDESHFMTSEFLGRKVVEDGEYLRTTANDFKKPRICNPDPKGVEPQQSIQSLDLLRKSSVPLEYLLTRNKKVIRLNY